MCKCWKMTDEMERSRGCKKADGLVNGDSGYSFFLLRLPSLIQSQWQILQSLPSKSKGKCVRERQRSQPRYCVNQRVWTSKNLSYWEPWKNRSLTTSFDLWVNEKSRNSWRCPTQFPCPLKHHKLGSDSVFVIVVEVSVGAFSEGPLCLLFVMRRWHMASDGSEEESVQSFLFLSNAYWSGHRSCFLSMYFWIRKRHSGILIKPVMHKSLWEEATKFAMRTKGKK